MITGWSRRRFLRALAFVGTILPAGSSSLHGRTVGRVAWAASSGLLDELRKAKIVKVGIANEPPYSSLNPDGSVTGLGPTVVQTILAKLSVPRVEGIVAPYGDLIPGLQARRWDIIGAVLSITKQRCTQVVYGDPIVWDGGAMAYIRGSVSPVPKSIGDLAQKGLTVGILTGSYLVPKSESLGVAAGKISQFPDNPSLIDGLVAKRVQIALSTYSSLRDLRKSRNDEFDISYPLPDDPPHGSGPAFRPSDTDLYDAYQRELRAMKRSGEFAKLSDRFGFNIPNGMLNETAQQACASAT
jgi:polar amino acid transport system substrate-binding protein